MIFSNNPVLDNKLVVMSILSEDRKEKYGTVFGHYDGKATVTINGFDIQEEWQDKDLEIKLCVVLPTMIDRQIKKHPRIAFGKTIPEQVRQKYLTIKKRAS